MRKSAIVAAVLFAALFTSANRASAFHRPPPYFYLGYYPPYAMFVPWNWTTFSPAFISPVSFPSFYVPVNNPMFVRYYFPAFPQTFYPVTYPFYFSSPPTFFFPVRQVIVPVFSSTSPRGTPARAGENQAISSATASGNRGSATLVSHREPSPASPRKGIRVPVSELRQPGSPMRYVGIKP
ncbi:MAG: hypothetical protein U1D30_01520 [Planctomycetota bacterium]